MAAKSISPQPSKGSPNDAFPSYTFSPAPQPTPKTGKPGPFVRCAVDNKELVFDCCKDGTIMKLPRLMPNVPVTALMPYGDVCVPNLYERGDVIKTFKTCVEQKDPYYSKSARCWTQHLKGDGVPRRRRMGWQGVALITVLVVYLASPFGV